MIITDETVKRHPFLAVFRYYGQDEVTREEYLETTYLGNPPEELGAELESMLPDELQLVNEDGEERI